MPQSEIHPQSPASMLHSVFASSYHDMKALEVIADKVQKAFHHAGRGRLDRVQLRQALRGIEVFYEDDELARILLHLVNTDLLGRGRDERSGKFFYYSRELQFNLDADNLNTETFVDASSENVSMVNEVKDISQQKIKPKKAPRPSRNLVKEKALANDGATSSSVSAISDTPCLHVVWKTRDGSGRMLRGILVAIIPAGECIENWLGRKSKNFSSVAQFDRRLVRTEEERYYAPAVDASQVFEDLRAAKAAVEAGVRKIHEQTETQVNQNQETPVQAAHDPALQVLLSPEELESLSFLDAMEVIKSRCEEHGQSMPESLMRQLLMKASIEIEYHEILKNSVRLLLNTVPSWASRPTADDGQCG